MEENGYTLKIQQERDLDTNQTCFYKPNLQCFTAFEIFEHPEPLPF
jgi:hypothetical protein